LSIAYTFCDTAAALVADGRKDSASRVNERFASRISRRCVTWEDRYLRKSAYVQWVTCRQQNPAMSCIYYPYFSEYERLLIL
jgi:hypothetical protein